MGILKENISGNILERNGFTKEVANVNAQLMDCYEKGVALNSTYYAYVAVNCNSSDVYIYIEYNCGGYYAAEEPCISVDYNQDPQRFFDELDEYVTDLAKRLTR